MKLRTYEVVILTDYVYCCSIRKMQKHAGFQLSASSQLHSQLRSTAGRWAGRRACEKTRTLGTRLVEHITCMHCILSQLQPQSLQSIKRRCYNVPRRADSYLLYCFKLPVCTIRTCIRRGALQRPRCGTYSSIKATRLKSGTEHPRQWVYRFQAIYLQYDQFKIWFLLSSSRGDSILFLNL